MKRKHQIAIIAVVSAIFTFNATRLNAQKIPDSERGLFASLSRKFLKTVQDKEEYLILNMRKVQKAAENYSSHHQGRYPTKLDNSFKSYFPMGNCDGKNYSSYTIPFNPFSKKPAWPILVTSTPSGSNLAKGALYFKPLGTKGYEIYAVGAKKRLLKDKRGRTIVLKTSKKALSLANARTVQWAAERYAETYKRYPIGVTTMFKYCFPEGDTVKKEGKRLFNPYTKKLFWPVTGKVNGISNARNSKPSSLPRGSIEYSCINGGKNYAIRIGGSNNLAEIGIRGARSTLVIGRDGDGRGKVRKW